MSDVPEAPRGWTGLARDQVGQAAGWMLHTWRNSLQMRVAATTLVITGAIVLIVGVVLVNQIASGVLNGKRDAAVTQVNVGLTAAREILDGVDAGDAAGVDFAVNRITQELTGGARSAGLFAVSVLAGGEEDAPQADDAIPTELRALVRDGSLASQYSPVSIAEDRPATAGLIVGAPVASRAGLFEVYYLFSLAAEEDTINLVRRTVFLAGLALVLLVVGIAVLVTRQVVRPVRVAAETAERLAAGDLAQRIPVHGADDIARLGQSFNDMAGSLQRQIRRLEELSRLQRRFTSDVSHELRTPLTTIRMASELLHAGRSEFPPELARSAELLQTELDRFEELLADLLEISRYDAGVAKLDSENTDLRDVVAKAIQASRMLASRHGSEIIVRQPDTPVTVDMDARRVERILRNLVGNALDHGEGESIVVTVACDEHAAAVTVRDHGVGLRPGEAALVFNRFWRGDPSRSRLTGGTGLGLAISLEDARVHDGWLQAWGERGRGAQFRLTLPRRAGHTLVSSPLPLNPDDVDEDESEEVPS